MSQPERWAFVPALRERLVQRIAAFDHRSCDQADLRPAAVAIVVCGMSDGRAATLLTQRSAVLGRHAGQYALPGGRVDVGEAARDAARRELHEELGLALEHDACLGRLDDYATRSGFCISSWVFWGGDQPALTPAPAEVEEVYQVPLSELDSTAIPHLEAGLEPDRPVLHARLPCLHGERMYAPTAALLYQFREVALRGASTRIDCFDQPRFAWR